jgi:protein-S-isoprenylcysteine O-methyltransferase Ste14
MDQQQDAAGVRVLPPLIPLAILLLGAALQFAFPLNVGFEIPAPARYWIGGGIVVGALLGLGLWSVLLMRGSGQNEDPRTPTTRILERGPFRVTRNPMYLQMVLVCFGVSIAAWNVWILLLTPVCAWLLQRLAIEYEEAYLERKFGDAYRAYQRRVRRWI